MQFEYVITLVVILTNSGIPFLIMSTLVLVFTQFEYAGTRFHPIRVRQHSFSPNPSSSVLVFTQSEYSFHQGYPGSFWLGIYFVWEYLKIILMSIWDTKIHSIREHSHFGYHPNQFLYSISVYEYASTRFHPIRVLPLPGLLR